MSEAAAAGMPLPSRDLSRKAAIVGLGETDYNLDYKAARAKAPGYELPTPESLPRPPSNAPWPIAGFITKTSTASPSPSSTEVPALARWLSSWAYDHAT